MIFRDQGSPQRRLGFFVFVGGLLGAYEAANFILSDDIHGLVFIAVGAVVAAFVIATLNNWQRGLYSFIFLLMFEDLVRKYLGNNMALSFVKDFIAAVLYLSFFLAWRRKQVQSFRPPFVVPLAIVVFFGIIQVFNPASPHLAFGVLGLKVYFYYIPLMFVGYGLIRSETDLRRFFAFSLMLILIVTSLGIAQSIIGPSFLTPARIQEDLQDVTVIYRVAPISGALVFRPTSVFVTTGRYVNLLNVAWLLALGFLGYTLVRYRQKRAFAFVSVVFLAAGLLLAASRGGFAWGFINAVIVMALFLWGASWRQQEVMRTLRSMMRVGLGIALAIAILLFSFPEALLGRVAVYYETLSPDSPASELVQRARDYPLDNFLGAFTFDRWPYGYGIGTTSLGAQYVKRFFHVTPLGGVESGFGGIILEMGIVGLILWLVLSFAILASVWKIVRRLRGSPWFPIASVIFLFTGFLLVPEMVGGLQAYQDYVLNAFFWLLLGVVFRLPDLRAAEEEVANQQPKVALRR